MPFSFLFSTAQYIFTRQNILLLSTLSILYCFNKKNEFNRSSKNWPKKTIVANRTSGWSRVVGFLYGLLRVRSATAVLIFQNAGPSCGQCEENVGLSHTIVSSSPLSALSALSIQLPSFLFLLFLFFLSLFSNFYNLFILFCLSFTLVGFSFYYN